MLCAITGIAGKPDGTVYASATFIIYRAPMSVVAQDARVVAPIVATTVSGADGSVALSLLSGNYVGVETASKVTFPLTVPESPTADFAACVAAAAVPNPSEYPASQVTVTAGGTVQDFIDTDAVVLTGAQTLTDKTIVSPIITGAPITTGITNAGRGQMLADLQLGQVFASRSVATSATTGQTGDADMIIVMRDGIALSYAYDAAGTALTTGDGRKWSPAGPTSVLHFSAAGDGVTDDRSAFNSASSWQSSVGGGIISVPYGGRYRIGSSFTVGRKVHFVGDHLFTDMTDRAYWGSIGSAILIDSAATISMANGAGLKGLAIQRYGMTFPNPLTATEVALFAGTAIMLASASAYIGYCSIMGFNQAIDDASTNTPRHRFEYLNIDCNNGIRIDQDLGMCDLYCCHCHAFLTGSAADNVRPGTAYLFENLSDWTKVISCFSYGYAVGFDVNNVNSMAFIGCGADFPASLYATSGSIGFRVRGDSAETKFTTCQVASQDTGFVFDNGVASQPVSFMTDCTVWQCASAAVKVTSGNVQITQGTYRTIGDNEPDRDNGTGILVEGSSSVVSVDGVLFNNITTAISAAAGAIVNIGLLNSYKDVAAQTAGLGTMNLRSFAHTGDVTKAENSNVTTIASTAGASIETALTARTAAERSAYLAAMGAAFTDAQKEAVQDALLDSWLYGVLAADYTLTSTTSTQKLFNWSANGALTLPTGVYAFETEFGITGMDATSGNGAFNLKGAGTATLTRILYHANGADAAGISSAGTQSGGISITGTTAASMVAAAVNTVLQASVRGTFEVTATGTLIPSIALVNAAAAVVSVGSYFRCRRIGAAGAATRGVWS